MVKFLLEIVELKEKIDKLINFFVQIPWKMWELNSLMNQIKNIKSKSLKLNQKFLNHTHQFKIKFET